MENKNKDINTDESLYEDKYNNIGQNILDTIAKNYIDMLLRIEDLFLDVAIKRY